MFKLLSKLVVPVMSLLFVIGTVYGITYYRFKELLNDSDNIQFVSAKERDRQLTCLARNIYFESATEPFEGKVAVAQVTLNRLEDPDFPKDLCQVVYQKNVVYEKTVCQFSWYCNHPSTLKIKDEEKYQESMEVAKKVLLEGFRLPGLKNAIYYHADYVKPAWNRVKIAQIGRHLFYSKDRKHG